MTKDFLITYLTAAPYSLEAFEALHDGDTGAGTAPTQEAFEAHCREYQEAVEYYEYLTDCAYSDYLHERQVAYAIDNMGGDDTDPREEYLLALEDERLERSGFFDHSRMLAQAQEEAEAEYDAEMEAMGGCQVRRTIYEVS